jgi:hypothetical protein
MSPLEAPKKSEDVSQLSAPLKRGAEVLQAAALALVVHLAPETAEAQTKRLRDLAAIPQECFAKNDPQNVCVKILPPRLEELAKFVADPSNIKRETPFYNPHVTSKERCHFLKRMITDHGPRLRALAEYMAIHHPEFVAETARAFDKQPDVLRDIDLTLDKADSFLGKCILSPIAVEIFLNTKEGNMGKVTQPLAKAVQLISAKLQEINQKSGSRDQKFKEALPHAQALENVLTVLSEAAVSK